MKNNLLTAALFALALTAGAQSADNPILMSMGRLSHAENLNTLFIKMETLKVL